MDTESEPDQADIHMEEAWRGPAIPPPATASNGQGGPDDPSERMIFRNAEQRRHPSHVTRVVTASAVRTAQWPATDAASIAEERRRTARRQQRRADQFDTGDSQLRQLCGNASTRGNTRHSGFPPIFTFDSRAPPTGSSSSTDMP